MFYLYGSFLEKNRNIRNEKQRYSVYKAEANIRLEADCERWCRTYFQKNNLDEKTYYVDHDKFPWRQTWEYIQILDRVFPYNLRPYMVERLKKSNKLDDVLNNIELANKLQAERNDTNKQDLA